MAKTRTWRDYVDPFKQDTEKSDLKIERMQRYLRSRGASSSEAYDQSMAEIRGTGKAPTSAASAANVTVTPETQTLPKLPSDTTKWDEGSLQWGTQVYYDTTTDSFTGTKTATAVPLFLDDERQLTFKETSLQATVDGMMYAHMKNDVDPTSFDVSTIKVGDRLYMDMATGQYTNAPTQTTVGLYYEDLTRDYTTYLKSKNKAVGASVVNPDPKSLDADFYSFSFRIADNDGKMVPGLAPMYATSQFVEKMNVLATIKEAQKAEEALKKNKSGFTKETELAQTKTQDINSMLWGMITQNSIIKYIAGDRTKNKTFIDAMQATQNELSDVVGMMNAPYILKFFGENIPEAVKTKSIVPLFDSETDDSYTTYTLDLNSPIEQLYVEEQAQPVRISKVTSLIDAIFSTPTEKMASIVASTNMRDAEKKLQQALLVAPTSYQLREAGSQAQYIQQLTEWATFQQAAPNVTDAVTAGRFIENAAATKNKLRDEFYTTSDITRKNEIILEWTSLDRGVEYSRTFMKWYDTSATMLNWGFFGQPDRYQNFLEAKARVELQKGTTLTRSEIRSLASQYSYTAADIIGSMVFDPLNALELLSAVPLFKFVSRVLTKAGTGERVLDNLSGISKVAGALDTLDVEDDAFKGASKLAELAKGKRKNLGHLGQVLEDYQKAATLVEKYSDMTPEAYGKLKTAAEAVKTEATSSNIKAFVRGQGELRTLLSDLPDGTDVARSLNKLADDYNALRNMRKLESGDTLFDAINTVKFRGALNGKFVVADMGESTSLADLYGKAIMHTVFAPVYYPLKWVGGGSLKIGRAAVSGVLKVMERVGVTKPFVEFKLMLKASNLTLIKKMSAYGYRIASDSLADMDIDLTAMSPIDLIKTNLTSAFDQLGQVEAALTQKFGADIEPAERARLMFELLNSNKLGRKNKSLVLSAWALSRFFTADEVTTMFSRALVDGEANLMAKYLNDIVNNMPADLRMKGAADPEYQRWVALATAQASDKTKQRMADRIFVSNLIREEVKRAAWNKTTTISGQTRIGLESQWAALKLDNMRLTALTRGVINGWDWVNQMWINATLTYAPRWLANNMIESSFRGFFAYGNPFGFIPYYLKPLTTILDSLKDVGVPISIAQSAIRESDMALFTTENLRRGLLHSIPSLVRNAFDHAMETRWGKNQPLGVNLLGLVTVPVRTLSGFITATNDMFEESIRLRFMYMIFDQNMNKANTKFVSDFTSEFVDALRKPIVDAAGNETFRTEAEIQKYVKSFGAVLDLCKTNPNLLRGLTNPRSNIEGKFLGSILAHAELGGTPLANTFGKNREFLAAILEDIGQYILEVGADNIRKDPRMLNSAYDYVESMVKLNGALTLQPSLLNKIIDLIPGASSSSVIASMVDKRSSLAASLLDEIKAAKDQGLKWEDSDLKRRVESLLGFEVLTPDGAIVKIEDEMEAVDSKIMDIPDVFVKSMDDVEHERAMNLAEVKRKEDPVWKEEKNSFVELSKITDPAVWPEGSPGRETVLGLLVDRERYYYKMKEYLMFDAPGAPRPGFNSTSKATWQSWRTRDQQMAKRLTALNRRMIEYAKQVMKYGKGAGAPPSFTLKEAMYAMGIELQFDAREGNAGAKLIGFSSGGFLFTDKKSIEALRMKFSIPEDMTLDKYLRAQILHDGSLKLPDGKIVENLTEKDVVKYLESVVNPEGDMDLLPKVFDDFVEANPLFAEAPDDLSKIKYILNSVKFPTRFGSTEVGMPKTLTWAKAAERMMAAYNPGGSIEKLEDVYKAARAYQMIGLSGNIEGLRDLYTQHFSQALEKVVDKQFLGRSVGANSSEQARAIVGIWESMSKIGRRYGINDVDVFDSLLGFYKAEFPNPQVLGLTRASIDADAAKAVDGLRQVIYSFQNANATTAIHEFSHATYNFLKYIGEKRGIQPLLDDLAVWDMEAKRVVLLADPSITKFNTPEGEKLIREAAATLFEKYIADEYVPARSAIGWFRTLKRIMVSAYRQMKNYFMHVDVQPKLRMVFDRMMSEEAYISAYEMRKAYKIPKDVPPGMLKSLKKSVLGFAELPTPAEQKAAYEQLKAISQFFNASGQEAFRNFRSAYAQLHARTADGLLTPEVTDTYKKAATELAKAVDGVLNRAINSANSMSSTEKAAMQGAVKVGKTALARTVANDYASAGNLYEAATLFLAASYGHMPTDAQVQTYITYITGKFGDNALGFLQQSSSMNPMDYVMQKVGQRKSNQPIAPQFVTFVSNIVGADRVQSKLSGTKMYRSPEEAILAAAQYELMMTESGIVDLGAEKMNMARQIVNQKLQAGLTEKSPKLGRKTNVVGDARYERMVLQEYSNLLRNQTAPDLFERAGYGKPLTYYIDRVLAGESQYCNIYRDNVNNIPSQPVYINRRATSAAVSPKTKTPSKGYNVEVTDVNSLRYATVNGRETWIGEVSIEGKKYTAYYEGLNDPEWQEFPGGFDEKRLAISNRPASVGDVLQNVLGEQEYIVNQKGYQIRTAGKVRNVRRVRLSAPLDLKYDPDTLTELKKAKQYKPLPEGTVVELADLVDDKGKTITVIRRNNVVTDTGTVKHYHDLRRGSWRVIDGTEKVAVSVIDAKKMPTEAGVRDLLAIKAGYMDSSHIQRIAKNFYMNAELDEFVEHLQDNGFLKNTPEFDNAMETRLAHLYIPIVREIDPSFIVNFGDAKIQRDLKVFLRNAIGRGAGESNLYRTDAEIDSIVNKMVNILQTNGDAIGTVSPKVINSYPDLQRLRNINNVLKPGELEMLRVDYTDLAKQIADPTVVAAHEVKPSVVAELAVGAKLNAKIGKEMVPGEVMDLTFSQTELRVSVLFMPEGAEKPVLMKVPYKLEGETPVFDLSKFAAYAETQVEPKNISKDMPLADRDTWIRYVNGNDEARSKLDRDQAIQSMVNALLSGEDKARTEAMSYVRKMRMGWMQPAGAALVQSALESIKTSGELVPENPVFVAKLFNNYQAEMKRILMTMGDRTTAIGEDFAARLQKRGFTAAEIQQILPRLDTAKTIGDALRMIDDAKPPVEPTVMMDWQKIWFDRNEVQEIYNDPYKWAAVNENFKRKFERSTVVDENGRPIPVVHGTFSEGYNVFDPAKGDFGFHLGALDQAQTRLEYKEKYMTGAARNTPENERYGVFFLDIRKPLVLNADPGEFDNLPSALYYMDEPELSSLGAEMKNRIYSSMDRDRKLAIIKQTLEAHGFDGVQYRNDFEGAGWSYMVWDPSKAKAVTNNGAWSDDVYLDAQNPGKIFTDAGIGAFDFDLSDILESPAEEIGQFWTTFLHSERFGPYTLWDVVDKFVDHNNVNMMDPDSVLAGLQAFIANAGKSGADGDVAGVLDSLYKQVDYVVKYVKSIDTKEVMPAPFEANRTINDIFNGFRKEKIYSATQLQEVVNAIGELRTTALAGLDGELQEFNNLPDDVADILQEVGNRAADSKSKMLDAALNGGNYSGVEMLDAVGETLRVMLDYSNTTRLDDTMRGFFPFWKFPSRSIPFWLDTIYKHPYLISNYMKYVRYSEQESRQQGYTNSRGEVLPSLRGYMKIPGMNVWWNPSASLLFKYIYPELTQDLDNDDADADSANAVTRTLRWLINQASARGFSLGPAWSVLLKATHVMDDPYGRGDLLYEAGKTVLPFPTDIIPPFMDKAILGKIDTAINPQNDGYFIPQVAWRDLLIEREVLWQAMREAEVATSQEAKVQIYNRARLVLSDPNRDQYPEWTAAVDRYDQEQWQRRLVGYFTGQYFKSIDPQYAEIMQVRDNINMLKKSINNDALARVFNLDEAAEDREARYNNARYEDPLGQVYDAYQKMNFVVDPITGAEVFNGARREQIARNYQDDAISEAYYATMAQIDAQRDEALRTQAIPGDRESVSKIWDAWAEARAEVEKNPMYDTAKRPWSVSTHAFSSIEKHYADVLWYQVQASRPIWNKDENESYADYQNKLKAWEATIPEIARSAMPIVLATIGRDVLKGSAAETYDFNSLPDKLLLAANLDGYNQWKLTKDSVYDALNNAWFDVYAVDYDPVFELSGARRELAIRDFYAKHPTPPTFNQLYEYVTKTYGDRFTRDQLWAAFAGRDVLDVEDYYNRSKENPVETTDIWAAFDLANNTAGGMSKLRTKIQELGGQDDWVTMWYDSGGNSEAWKDPEDFQKFHALVVQAAEDLGFEPLTTAELNEKAMAEDLNAQFKTLAKQKFGEDIDTLISINGGLPYASKKEWQRTHPNEYNLIKQYYQFKDSYGYENQAWAKYYWADVYMGSTGSGESPAGGSYGNYSSGTSYYSRVKSRSGNKNTSGSSSGSVAPMAGRSTNDSNQLLGIFGNK